MTTKLSGYLMYSRDYTSSKESQGRSAIAMRIGLTRKEIVVIAVLVNMALLAILFALADRQKSQHQHLSNIEEAFTVSAQNMPIEANKSELLLQGSSGQPIDEIDQILQEYANKANNVDQKSIAVNESSVKLQKHENSQAAKNRTQVKVQKGDSIAKIAKVYGVKAEDIISLNGLVSEKLKIGQILFIPETKSVPVATVKKTATSTVHVKEIQATGSEYYVIRSGDNPWKIARKFHLKFEDLLALNGLDEESAKNLKVGQRIRIR